MRDLRCDHAGESGAVAIYEGILAVSTDTHVRRFANSHLRTEREHLNLFNRIPAEDQRSRLLPLWRIAGWLTGALPALIGRNAVFLTIDAVETFVEAHYDAQIDRLRNSDELATIQSMLERCRSDEVEHRN